MQHLNIAAYVTPFLKSNMYLLTKGSKAIVIDPYWDKKIKYMLDGYNIDICLLTHEHYDHISGVNALKSNSGARVICSRAAAVRLSDPTANAARYFPAFNFMQGGESPADPKLIDPAYACKADESFNTEYEFSWEGHHFFLKHTPGHSPGSACILADGAYLFSGDTLLKEGGGVARFPGGNQEEYNAAALPFLQSLRAGIRVYPGHYGQFALNDIINKGV